LSSLPLIAVHHDLAVESAGQLEGVEEHAAFTVFAFD
jgi:hypothetical protein